MEYKFSLPLDDNDIANLPLPEGSASVMRIDLASGNCSAIYDNPQPPPKDPTPPSKVSLTKNENFVALGNPLKMANDKATQGDEAGSAATNDKTTRADEIGALATNDKTTRVDEVVASAASNDEAGNPGGDRDVANTATTAGNSSKNKNKKKSAEKKPAEKATSSSAVGESATAGKSEDVAKGPAAVTHEMWSQMRALLDNSGDVASNPANRALFEKMFARCPEHSAPTPKPSPMGPTCGNPACGVFGHTLSVCPVPTSEDGDMAGCFFCNVTDHDADDCAMMEWVSPATLVTHLITNRAGMPPWDTRIDWVALAIGEWDLVCFTMLPLTRDFVKKEYIPGKRWTEVKGVSPITDPIFADASLRSLKAMAKPKPDDPKRRAPLMEASQTLCYCEHGCYDGLEHTIFKNKIVGKYIADMKLENKVSGPTVADRERALAATQAQMAKKVPKKVTKERKGRRAMKKEAMAAAAAEEEAAGPSEPKNVPAEKKDQVEKELNVPSEDENPAPLSQQIMELADTVGDVIDSIQKTIKS